MSNIEQYANPQILDLVAYEPGKPIEETARELGMVPEDIVKLASNENPLGPSPKAVQAMCQAASQANIYPDGAAFRLRTAIANRYQVDFNQTIVGSGSSEIIELVGHAFLNRDAEVVAAEHAFSMYPIMSKLFGARYVQVPNKPDWSHDLKGFLDAITDKTRVVFITNPTNPLGTIVSQQEIDDFMAHVPNHVVVCFDEAYHEFSDQPADTVKFVRDGRQVVVLKTFSKVYGLAGLRIGFGLAPQSLCTLLHKCRTPFNAHLLAQEAALAALDDQDHIRKTIENNNAEMTRYEEAFQSMNLEWIPSHANFVLVKVGHGRDVFQALLKRGVITRAQDGYGLPEWLRISIGTPKENIRCIDMLREVLAQ